MFEKAIRMKLRFHYRGTLDTEDLWDLNLGQLDSIYRELNAELKELSEDSLLKEHTAENQVLQLKVDIVKHIFEVKYAEQKEREQEAENKASKQRLLEIIADKQDEQFRNMPLEELTKLVEEL